jgi:hypothetical protein
MRTVHAVLVAVSLGCSACPPGTVTLTLETHREGLTNDLRQRETDAYIHLERAENPTEGPWDAYKKGKSGADVTSTPVFIYPNARDQLARVVLMFMRSDGRVLARGEVEARATEGAVWVMHMSATGPQ